MIVEPPPLGAEALESEGELTLPMEPGAEWDRLAQSVAEAHIGQVGLVEIDLEEGVDAVLAARSIPLDDRGQGGHLKSGLGKRARE